MAFRTVQLPNRPERSKYEPESLVALRPDHMCDICGDVWCEIENRTNIAVKIEHV